MRLPRPFIRVPLAFDAARLAAEVDQFERSDWRPHPQGHPGNWSLPLIALDGDPAREGVAGPMRPTPQLARCPYIRQVMAELRAPLGRSRLMKLDARAEATAHVDINHYWMQRVRVHVPVVTLPEVRFLCGDAVTRMAAGECWIFDTWRRHNVLNPTSHERIHLVMDTVGSDAFWELVENSAETPRQVSFASGIEHRPACELVNLPTVMSPWEFELSWRDLLSDARLAAPDAAPVDALAAAVEPILRQWRALWARYGDGIAGWPEFAHLAADFQRRAHSLAASIVLPNGVDLASVIEGSLVPALHTPERRADSRSVAAHVPDLGQIGTPMTPTAGMGPAVPRFDRPLIIVAAPRSGSSLLFETLAQAPGTYTVGNESHLQFESLSALRPESRGYESNRLSATDATAEVADEIRRRFVAALRDRDGTPLPPRAAAFRLVEKTPKNALRIPFLDAVFPDALYVYLYREPAENLSSLIEGWQSGRFVMYPDLPGWLGPPWSFLLVPGWRELTGASLAVIVAAQWQRTQEVLLDDLAALPRERVFALTYDELLADPQTEIRRICAFAGIVWDRMLPTSLPLSSHTVTPPMRDKWRRHEGLLASQLPSLSATADRARAFVAACRANRNAIAPPSIPAPAAAPASGPGPPREPATTGDGIAPLASVHTSNLPDMLRELGASLLITTYQAGQLILARADGPTLNTHFVGFNKPMGLAVDRDRLLVGTDSGIREFRNVPAAAAKLDPPRRHDAVYVFRNHHVTANIDIHEMAFAGLECWYVNTLFSCLCTLDHDHSFVPRWRPRFITGLAPEDRCHLNGMAIVGGQPKFMTALAASDTPQGWRAHKKDGGVLIDYASREPIVRGLSMPHSPRWHRGRLWLLESGRGSLATVDLKSGKIETVARVPGFTRGLDFIGPLAFIGLSQLRETNAFTDIPITDDNSERLSGVWVVNVETGRTAAFLKFSRDVQEIFAVQALRGALFPALVDEDDPLIKTTYVLPDEALKEIRLTATKPNAAAGANMD
ncbi:MAG TPA: TIGR03032 family protein [Casimicrobiaceae bacterium]|nr:TIGR03032 family protein [Casimicrobiaceae bacterium]